MASRFKTSMTVEEIMPAMLALGNELQSFTELKEKLKKTDLYYTLSIATTTALGGVKIGNGLSIDADGLVSVNINGFVPATELPLAAGTAAKGSSDRYAREDHVHPLQTTVSGSSGSCTGNAATATAFQTAQSVSLTGDVIGSTSSTAGWEIETTLKDSGVTAGSYGPSANATPGYGATFNVPYITVDAKGRVTSASTKTIKIPASDNTNTTYTLTQDTTDKHKLTFAGSDGTSVTITTPDTNTTYTFTNKAATLAWNTTSTIATVGGTDITVALPANPNTDTHWTSHLYAGGSGATANAATSNGGTYLSICDNSSSRNSIKITGSGATTVTSDANGVITISSTNTTYTPASATPLIAGTGTVGTSAKYAREDHVHPVQTTISGNAGSATKLATARTIDGVDFNGSAVVAHYGSCSTAAATVEKTVACTGFKLVSSARIIVTFTVTNTAANPTLNVNSTGAKAIQYRKAAISAGYLAANRTYEFVYDGTQYQLVGDINTDTNNVTAQNVSTTNATYPVLLGNTADATANIGNKATLFGSGVKVNPSTSTIVATTFQGNLTGNVTGNCSGTSANVTGTVAIANGGTGATTRLNAIKALTNENVSTNATHFLGLKSDWSKVGYFTISEAKTLLGLGSAAYTASTAYAAASHSHDLRINVNEIGRYVDMHYDNATAKYDYDVRFQVNSQGTAAGGGVLQIVAASVKASKFEGPLTGNVTGNCSGSSGSCTGTAANATTWNGLIDDHKTENNTDTWIPVFKDSKLQHTVRTSMTVGYANKLATARSLWGNNFDGSANLTGKITTTEVNSNKYNYTHPSYTTGDSITANQYMSISYKDKAGTQVSDILDWQNSSNNGGSHALCMRAFGNAYYNNGSRSDSATVGACYNTDGTKYAFCTEPPTDSYSNHIVTTKWLKDSMRTDPDFGRCMARLLYEHEYTEDRWFKIASVQTTATYHGKSIRFDVQSGTIETNFQWFIWTSTSKTISTSELPAVKSWISYSQPITPWTATDFIVGCNVNGSTAICEVWVKCRFRYTTLDFLPIHTSYRTTATTSNGTCRSTDGYGWILYTQDYNSAQTKAPTLAVTQTAKLRYSGVHYCGCTTASGTAAKVVNDNDTSDLEAGRTLIYVYFQNGNTAANPTLNVSDLGAYPIRLAGAAVPTNYIVAKHTYPLLFNGDTWLIVG